MSENLAMYYEQCSQCDSVFLEIDLEEIEGELVCEDCLTYFEED